MRTCLFELITTTCDPTRQHQATREQLTAAGLSSSAIGRAKAAGLLVRLRRRVYATAPLEPRGRHLLSGGRIDLPYLAETRAALSSLGGGTVADRRTAAVLWQMDLLVEPASIECRVPATSTHVDLAGVDVRLSDSTAHVDLAVAGLAPVPVTTAVDTVLDCAEDRPLLEAVVIADSALRRRLVTVDDLVRGVAARSGHPRVTRLRKVLALVDPQSGSVLETLVRVLLAEHGLHPQSQYVVRARDGKRFVGRVDLCFEEQRVVIECDGRQWHDPEDARNRDRRRDNELARAGWLVLRFTWDDVCNSKAYLLAAVRDALLSAAA